MVTEFLADAAAVGLFSSTATGLQIMRDAPHLLGAEGAAHSNYIAGSFAAFPRVDATLVAVGELVPATVCVGQPPDGRSEALVAVAGRARWTVVLAGSST